MKISIELRDAIVEQVAEEKNVLLFPGVVESLLIRAMELVIENQLGEEVEWVTQNELVHPTQH